MSKTTAHWSAGLLTFLLTGLTSKNSKFSKSLKDKPFKKKQDKINMHRHSCRIEIDFKKIVGVFRRNLLNAGSN